MNWFRANRWLGTFLIVFGVCAFAALYFLFTAKTAFEAATTQLNEAINDRTRLERLKPFPNEANYQKMKQGIASYGEALNKLKQELKAQVVPVSPLAPNEFQSHLRQAMTETADRARTNKVKLPDNFHLGFDEYTTALPNTAAAPLLGQELTQILLLVTTLANARVDAIIAFKRMPLPEESLASTTPTPALRRQGVPSGGMKMLRGATVEIAFTSSPSAGRKVLNEIASSNRQFFIIRTLHVRNQQEKGPPRESGLSGAAATPPAVGASSSVPAALKFIVGNEHIETTAQIEIVGFTF